MRILPSFFERGLLPQRGDYSTTKVRHIIERLLPNGSTPEGGRSHKACPKWPPDLFAVAASLVDLSACYSGPRFTAAWDGTFHFDAKYLDYVGKYGEQWREECIPPDGVAKLWNELLAHWESPLNKCDAWSAAAIRLTTIADEAARGMGFRVEKGEERFPFAKFVLSQYLRLAEEEASKLPYVPWSLCNMVPDTEVCVQPKALTPKVGCTLRSLTHHLSLLPPRTVVKSEWIVARGAEDNKKPFNLLLVPFPYVIHDECFCSTISEPPSHNRFFVLKPTWLEENGARISAKRFAEFLHDLLATAKQHVPDEGVHGLVLPECALTRELARDVATELAQDEHLELFVSGVSYTDPGHGQPANAAFIALFRREDVLHTWTQSKHHRWKLDGGQIEGYGLSGVLNEKLNWWEQICVNDRSLVFSPARWGSTLAVLICEDLARADPVQPVVRAIGPNLVIALLLDGPQRSYRWPARYATSLADDPGSSVLTLTCMGMLRRWTRKGETLAETKEAKIALWKQAVWKQANSRQEELSIPSDSHALLVRLESVNDFQESLDGRHDDEAAQLFNLTKHHAIRLDPQSIPAWLRLDEANTVDPLSIRQQKVV